MRAGCLVSLRARILLFLTVRSAPQHLQVLVGYGALTYFGTPTMCVGKNTAALLTLLLSVGCLANADDIGPLRVEPSRRPTQNNYLALQRALSPNAFSTHVSDAPHHYRERKRVAEGPAWFKTGSGAHLVPPPSPHQPYQKV